MIELIATAVITVASALLFGYWFRYTCLLILSAQTARDFAGQVATANRLRFMEVQSRLQVQGPLEDMGLLQDALNRDFLAVSQLLKEANTEEGSLENRMLAVHYRMLSAWFGVSRRISVAAARGTLEQMSQVVAHFANALGEQAVAGAAA